MTGRELGSGDAQQPGRQVVQQYRSFQSNQPIPNPDHDRTGKPVLCPQRGAREASRSQKIDKRSFHEEAVKTDRTGQPVVETGRTQTRSSVETHKENVPEGFQTRSCHESTSFNVGDETIRDRTEQPVVNHDEPSHEQTMLNEVNMDFRNPGLPHSVVKHAESSRVRE